MEAVGHDDSEGIDDLWSGFKTLMRALQVQENDPEYLKPQSFKTHVREWGKLFLEMFYDDDITPYIHTFVYHVPQFLEKYGTLMQFNFQPVEKKNHWQSQKDHRGSQKGGKNSKYTVQVMEQENRLMFARCNNLKRKRKSYVKSKLPANPESSDEEEAPDSQIGSVHVYNHHEEQEG
ncbi:uncharacterized protein [Pocillopora verrucosa]|uniref:uncharacterized protein n=1 Tax=Pocillopora verrucosa TaxID=203993 RepID=UPI00333E727F